MFRLRMILGAAALLLAVAAPQVWALAGAQGASNNPTHSMYGITKKKTDLSPIVVYGQHMPVVVAFQIYKKALTRSWSSSDADLGKLVCRWRANTGTHVQSLHCMTNRQHQRLVAATQRDIGRAVAEYDSPDPIRHAFESGELSVILTRVSGPRSALAPLIQKSPPANASYTLRETDHGKPLPDYVFRNGDLVHVYVYENGQPVEH